MDKDNNLSELYKDEKQDSIEALKAQADHIEQEYPRVPFTVRDIVLDIIFFFVTVAIAFGWGMIMLMIFSFVTLSYLHFEFTNMIIISVVLAVGTGIYYIVKKVRKYSKLR